MNKNYQVIQIKWPFDSPVFFTVTLVSPSPTVSTPDVSTPVSGTSVGRITRLICLDLESRPQINWKCHRKRRAIFGVLDKEYDWTILLDWFQWSWALSGAFFTSFFLSWVFFEILNFQLFVELPNFECTNFKNSEIYEITNMRNGRFQPSSQKIHLFISTKKTHMAVFLKVFFHWKLHFLLEKPGEPRPGAPNSGERPPCMHTILSSITSMSLAKFGAICGTSSWWLNQPTHLKNMLSCLLVKLDSIIPKVRDEHKTYLSCHQLVLSIFKTNEHEYFMVFVSNEITTQWKWMNLEMSWGFSLKKSSMNLWFL